MAKSDNLRKAKEQKNDEFYTRLEDIEAEISMHPDYVRQFHGKTVFCNCDDPEWSAFYEFFRLHFNQLRLKKLITTHYNKDGSPSYKLEWDGEMLGDDTINMIKTPLQGNGDFRSDECIELLKEADIVVTNPPFSLYREYVALLEKYEKQYVILGNPNSIAYKEVFPLLKTNKMFIGYKSMGTDIYFNVTDEQKQVFLETGKEGSNYVIKNGVVLGRAQAVWFTNLDLDKIHEPMILTKNYDGNEEKYPKYDNYDAIDIPSIKDIPKDYNGVMGVPITFLAFYCTDQFEIIGSGTGNSAKEIGVTKNYRGRTDLAITENGKSRCPYNRILIRRKAE